MSSWFDPDSTSIQPQKPWTFPFYGSINGPGLKTLVMRWYLDEEKCSYIKNCVPSLIVWRLNVQILHLLICEGRCTHQKIVHIEYT